MGDNKPRTAPGSRSEVDLLQGELHENPDCCCIKPLRRILCVFALQHINSAFLFSSTHRRLDGKASQAEGRKYSRLLMPLVFESHKNPAVSINMVRRVIFAGDVVSKIGGKQMLSRTLKTFRFFIKRRAIVCFMVLALGTFPEARVHSDDSEDDGLSPLDHLTNAALIGDINEVEESLAAGVPINAPGSFGHTALHQAALRGHLDVVALLVSKGADLTARDKDGDTPLMIAVSNNYYKVAKFLIEKGADVNTKNNNGTPLIRRALSDSKLEILKLLIAHGADINIKCQNDHDLIWYAHLEGSFEAADILRTAQERNVPREPVESTNSSSEFTSSANSGSSDTSSSNISAYSSSPATRSLDGSVSMTDDSLCNAAERGDLSEVRRLLDQGAAINAKCSWLQITPLFFASNQGHTDIVRLLIERGSEVDSKANEHSERQTPLLAALWRNNWDTAGELIMAGADVNYASSTGFTPLQYAIQGGDLTTVQLLVSKGADVNAPGWDTETPLHTAAKIGKIDVADFLLRNGAEINGRSRLGKTPLNYAQGNLYMQRFLKEQGGKTEMELEIDQRRDQ